MKTDELLISLYQNTSTALQSISDIKEKTEDKQFLKLLEAQEERYKNIMLDIEEIATQEKVELKDNNWFEKARLWTSIQFSTMTNNTIRHLAEMMLLGTVMGTLTLYKDRADYKGKNQKVIDITLRLEETEEKNFNELKKYLKETHK